MAAATGTIAAPGTAIATAGSDLSVMAGSGKVGHPSPGPATSSALDTPNGVAFDSAGDVYIADSGNNVVEKVTPSGTLSVFAGTGSLGAPTPGPATSSALNGPGGVAVDPLGDVYIADSGNNVVEKVTPLGTLSVFAGTGTVGAPTPGPATSSALNSTNQIALDPSGDLYITDSGNQVVEKVTPFGILSIFAGSGRAGRPTPGAARSSDLNYPGGVAIDPSGNVFICDFGNRVVEKVTPAGTLSIFAGTGTLGPPTAGPATSSDLGGPAFDASDSSGNIYIADFSDNVVERVTPSGTLSIFAGRGPAGTPTPGSPTLSDLDQPVGVAVDPSGNVYIGDAGNNVVEEVSLLVPSPPVIDNLPNREPVGSSFDPTVSTSGDGSTSVTSSSTSVCTVTGPNVRLVGAGTCVLTAHVGVGASYAAASGTPQSFPVDEPTVARCTGGYWIATANGAVYSYGSAAYYGSLTGLGVTPAEPIVGVAPTPDCRGYWLVAGDGGIFAFGDARFFGSMGGRTLDEPVVGMTATPEGGYYEVAADGGLFAFGPGTSFFGSMGGRPLIDPVVGMAVTLQGGYYEVSGDGGIFAFGPGATFLGSMGGQRLAQPMEAMAVDPGGGYYEVARDGGIFAFGAPFRGSTGCLTLSGPIVAMVISPITNTVGHNTSCGHPGAQAPGGYRLVARDGGVFSFGNASFDGSIGGQGIDDVVGMADA